MWWRWHDRLKHHHSLPLTAEVIKRYREAFPHMREFPILVGPGSNDRELSNPAMTVETE